MQLLEFFIDVTVRTAGAVASLTRVNNAALGTAGNLNKTGGAAAFAGKRMLAMAGGALSLYKVGQLLGGGMIDVQNGMIGVAKTTGLAGEELDVLKKGYRELANNPDVNASVSQLFQLGEIAGTAGIKSAEQILKFSETLAKLNSASGGKLQGESGAKAILNILDAADEGIDVIDRLGSSITQLGNDFRVNEAEIAATATRVSNSLRAYGASSADIVALSTAFAELRLSPELAQTAISKTLNSMSLAIAEGGADLERFKKITGLSRSEIERLLKTDGAALFTAFAQGLNRMQAEGDNLTVVLKGVGLESQRTGDTLKAIGVRADRLTEIMASSNAAFQENTALNEEAAAAGESFQAKAQAMGNSIMFLGDAIASTGLLDAIGTFLSLLSSGIFIITDFISALDPVAAGLAILPALLWVLVPPLIAATASLWAMAAALLANPLVWIFAAMAAAIYTVVAVFRNWGKIVDWFKAKFAGFGLALTKNPIFFIGKMMAKMVSKIWESVGGLSGLGSFFGGALSAAFAPFKWFAEKVGGIFSWIWDKISFFVTNNPLFNLPGFINNVIPAVNEAFKGVYLAAKGWLFDKLGAILDWARGKIEGIRNWFSKKIEKVKDVVGLGGGGDDPPSGPVNFGGGTQGPSGDFSANTFQDAGRGSSVTQDNSVTVDRIEVNALPGQDPEDIADRVVERLERADRRLAIDATN